MHSFNSGLRCITNFGLLICHYHIETTPTVAMDSSPGVKPPPTSAAPEAAPADSSSNSPVTDVVTAESEADAEEQNSLNHNQVKEEMVVVSDKIKEQEKIQGEKDKEMKASAAETGKDLPVSQSFF